MKKRYKWIDFISINNIIIYCVFFILIISFFIVTDTSVNLNTYKIEDCSETFFEFDKIEYYNIENNDINEETLIQHDSIKRKMLNEYFTNLNDSINLEYVEKYYKKNKLSLRALKFIKSYVCKTKTNLSDGFSECIPIFRDILIFKKESKIVGIIKICFECELSNFITSDYTSFMFNPNELDILQKFLIENKK